MNQEQISKQNLKKWVSKNLKENKFVVGFLLLLSTLSFYIWFGWPRDDQTLHVPIIYQLIDGSLYSRDYFLTFATQNYASNFHYFMAAISTQDNLFYVYLSLTFILNIVFTFGIFFLAKQILNNTNIALLTTVIFSIPYRFSLELVELSVMTLLPRTFVLAFMPLIIYLYIRNIQNYSKIRALVVFALLGLLYNIHPVSALPIIIATLGTEFLYFKRFNSIYFMILIFALTLPTNLHYLALTTTSPVGGEVIQDALKLRTPYHTFDYRIKALLGLYIYAPILALIAYYMKHRDRTEADKILISWVMFFCFFSFISIVISNFVSSKLIFHMLPRAWKYGYLLSIIYAVLLVSLLWNKRKFRDRGGDTQKHENMNTMRRGTFISKVSKFSLSKLSAILIIFFLIVSALPFGSDEYLTPKSIASKYAHNSYSLPFTLFVNFISYDKPLGKIFYNSFYSSENKYICRWIEYSKERQELKDIGDWLKKNTDKDALIMTYPPDFFFAKLETYSQRSILVNYEDGAMGMFSEEVFRKWWEQYNEVKNGNPIEVANKYDVDYILTNSSINLHLEKVYYTEHFNLYKTR